MEIILKKDLFFVLTDESNNVIAVIEGLDTDTSETIKSAIKDNSEDVVSARITYVQNSDGQLSFIINAEVTERIKGLKSENVFDMTYYLDHANKY